MSPRTARHALLLALLAVLPAVAPPPAGAVDPGVSLDARATEDGLAIRLGLDGPAEPVNVVVSHVDPLLGEVVDRVVPIQVGSDGVAEVEVRGLRAEGTFSVRALPGDVPLPRLSPVAELVNGSALAELPRLAQADVARAPASNATPVRAFPAFVVAKERGSEATSRVVVTRAGLVVVAWMEPTKWYDPEAFCHLRVAVSRDGGRTYAPPATPGAPVKSLSGSCPRSWTLAEAAGGEVLVLEDAPGDAEPARASLFDPAEGAFVARVALEANLTLGRQAAAAPLPDGSVALAVVQGRVDGRALAPVTLWRVGVDGRVSLLASLQEGAWEGLRVAASGRGDVAVVWSSRNAIEHAVSRDGGRTFAHARVPIPNGSDSQLELRQALMDDLGVLHVTITNAATGEGFYARAPPGLPAEVRRVCGSDPQAVHRDCYRAQDLFVAVAGARVWLFWEGFSRSYGPQDDRHVRQYAAESTTAGAAFGPPYAVEDHPGNRVSAPYDTAVLPDGRPLLLGYYFFPREGGGEDAWIATVPVFDPLAAPASGLTVLRNATSARASLAAAPPAPAPEILGTRFTTAPGGPDANATLRVDVRNAGATAAPEVHLAVEGLPAPLRVAAPVEAFRLAAAGRLSKEIALQGVEAWTGGEVDATLVVSGPGLRATRVPVRLSLPAAAPPERPTPDPPGPDVGPPVLLPPPTRDVLPPAPDAEPRLPVAPGTLAAGSGIALAAVVVGAAAATEAGKLVLLGAAAALYSRIARSDVLTNEVRAGVYRRIRERPGERFEALRRDLGLASGTLAFHLRVLQREGYVTSRRDWTRRRFYASGETPPPEPGRADAVVLRALESAPGGLAPVEVARRLGISRQLARHHLLALARAGRARAVREGRTVRYVAAEGPRFAELHVVDPDGRRPR